MARDLGGGKIMGGNVENPHWREDLIASIMERRRKAQPKANPDSPAIGAMLRVVGRPEWVDLMHKAAAVQGYSLSTYARRVLSISAALDLDMDVHDLLALCPEPTAPKYAVGNQGRRTLYRAGSVDTGEGIEKWCPHPGCDGEHLR